MLVASKVFIIVVQGSIWVLIFFALHWDSAGLVAMYIQWAINVWFFLLLGYVLPDKQLDTSVAYSVDVIALMQVPVTYSAFHIAPLFSYLVCVVTCTGCLVLIPLWISHRLDIHSNSLGRIYPAHRIWRTPHRRIPSRTRKPLGSSSMYACDSSRASLFDCGLVVSLTRPFYGVFHPTCTFRPTRLLCTSSQLPVFSFAASLSLVCL